VRRQKVRVRRKKRSQWGGRRDLSEEAEEV
jgi:hypothetical protein